MDGDPWRIHSSTEYLGDLDLGTFRSAFATKYTGEAVAE